MLLAFIATPILKADNTGSDSEDGDSSDEVKLYEKTEPNYRPNSDFELFIRCNVYGNRIEFSSSINLSNMTVSIYNDSYGWIDLVSSENNSVLCPLPKGYYNIECYTSDGRVFSGKINL